MVEINNTKQSRFSGGQFLLHFFKTKKATSNLTLAKVKRNKYPCSFISFVQPILKMLVRYRLAKIQ